MASSSQCLRRLGLAAVLVLAAASGCDDTVRLEPGERYARRFVPFDPRWIPESQIPAEPQRSPSMVIWEFSESLDEPGPEEARVADEWVERCHEAAVRHGWDDFGKGLSDGYERYDRHHYVNPEYMTDGRALDPDRPEFLMYYALPDGTQALAGFMFMAENRVDRGRQLAGLLTLWHYHVYRDPMCVIDGSPIALHPAVPGARCKEGEPVHRTPEMMHTWLIDHPYGPFATSMILTQELVAEGVAKRRLERGY